MASKILGKAITDYMLPLSAWETLIDEWIFDEFDRKLLKRKILDNAPYKILSDELGFSEKYLQRKVARGVKELIKHL